jgi:hypothetical protein
MIFRTSQYHPKINQFRLNNRNKKQSSNKKIESSAQQVISNIRNLISLLKKRHKKIYKENKMSLIQILLNKMP